MRTSNLIAFVAMAMATSAACHSSGAPGGAGSAGASPGAAGSAGAAGGTVLEGGAGAVESDAQAPSDGGASGSGDGAADGGAIGTDDPTAPFPFDVGAAETVLGQQVEATREILDTQTIEYLLTGSTITAQIDQTRWATAGEAEFECQRAAGTGATLVVGPDYTMFAASDAIELARDVFCSRIRVVSASVYSAPLTTSFADIVLAPR